MPNLQPDAAALRAPGYKRRVYFAKFDPAVVFQCTVDSTPADGALNLTVTATAGSIASVYRGFLAWVETAGGAFKGMTNIRAAGTLSATNLPIHELAPADIAIAATDVVKVYNIPYLGDKLPRANTSFAPDDLTYTNQGTAIAPRVNSGGHWIGFVDGLWSGTVQTYATVPMPGVSSAEDPDSGGSLTHLWTLLTGTLTFAPGSANTDANPTLRASVGYGIALHTVTDSSNSVSWSQFVCTQVYDASTPPYRVLDASLNGEEAGGWTAESVELYQNATLTALPDGWMCGLFVVETINGSYISYGNAYSGRSHIKLIGFLYRDENELTPQINRVRFGIRGALAHLATLPGFSKVLARDGSGWSQLDDLTVRLVIVQILRYYSFFMEMFDLVFANFPAKDYPAYYLQTKTALDQLREVADGVDCRIANTRTGELLAHPRPELIPLADRAAVTVTWDVQRQDYGGRARLSRDHWKPMQMLEARGFTASTTNDGAQPILSRYPGLTPGRGSATQVVERLIADSQDDLNERTGRRGATLDGAVIDADGAYRRAVEWTGDLPQTSALDVFDFYPEYVTTSDFDAASNLRGLDLTLDYYYLNAISVHYRTGGAADISPTWLTATNAPDAATWIPPNVAVVTPYYPPPNVPLPPVVPPFNGVLPTRGIVLSASEGKAALITGLTGASLLFSADFGGITSTAFYGGCSNPWNYDEFWALGDAGVEITPDQEALEAFAVAQTNTALFGAGNIGHRIRGSIHRNGLGMAVSGSNYLRRTLDGWATLQSAVSINGAALDADDGSVIDTRCDICECGHDAGHWYATAVIPLSVNNDIGLYRSTDNGATWSLYADLSPQNYNANGRAWLDIPYMRTDGTPNRDDASIEIRLYLAGDVGGDSGIIDGVTNAAINNSFPLVNKQETGALNYTPFSSFAYDASYYYFCDGRFLRRTTDDFVTLSADLLEIATGGEGSVSANGWSSNPEAAVAWSSNPTTGTAVWATADGGATWVSGFPSGWAAGVAYAEFSLYTVQ